MSKTDFFADILAAQERILDDQESYVKYLTDKLSKETSRLVELRRARDEFKRTIQEEFNADKHR